MVVGMTPREDVRGLPDPEEGGTSDLGERLAFIERRLAVLDSVLDIIGGQVQALCRGEAPAPISSPHRNGDS